MLTGVEVAGIALGAFPVCIELVKLYMVGAEAFDVMRHHRYALEEFQRELEMEYAKFVNTIYEVYGDEITQKDLEYILLYEVRDSTGGASAQEPLRLDHMFHRPHASENFINAVKALKIQLKRLEEFLPALHLDTDSTKNMTTVQTVQCIKAGSKNPKVKT